MTTTAQHIAESCSITVDAADAIADAIADAHNSWTGLGWNYTVGCGDDCFEVPAGTTVEQAEAEAETATDEDIAKAWRRGAKAVEQITNLSRCAEREASEAIGHAIAGDLDSAHASAEEACRSEREASGDDPTWHPLMEALNAAFRELDDDEETR